MRQAGPEAFILPGGFMRAYGTLEQPNPYAGYLGYTAPLAASLALAAALVAWRKRSPRDLALGRRSSPASPRRLVGRHPDELVARRLAGARSRAGAVAALRNWRTALVTGAVIVALALAVAIFGAGWLPPSIAGRVQDLGTTSPCRTPPARRSTTRTFRCSSGWRTGRPGCGCPRMQPWLGVGIGNYGASYGRYPQPHWYEPLGHAHNVFINFLAETGVLGLAAFLVFWLGVAAVAWRSGWNSRTRGTRRLASASWVHGST